MIPDWKTKNRSRFGGRFDKYKIERTGGTWASKYGSNINHWDIAPEPEYFEELFRISKQAIIWGGNYFPLPTSRNFIVWKKLTISENFSMAMAEYAWTNITGNAKVIEYAPQGKLNDERFHPTQKPIYLYKKLLQWYAKPGDKIFDSHVGSGSIRIACHDLGFDFEGCEIDKDYWEAQEARFQQHIKQAYLFEPQEIQDLVVNGELFVDIEESI